MAVGEQQILTMLRRKGHFIGQLRDLENLMTGDAAFIADYIGEGKDYDEHITRKLIKDILRAYDDYSVAEFLIEIEGLEPNESAVDDAGDQPVASDDSMSALDSIQQQLVSSMLYCLIRLVAESPWYSGRFGELEEACWQLLDSFGRGVPSERFLAPEIAACEFGAQPGTPERVAYRFDMVMSFPMLGEDELIPFDEEHPEWFLDDLNTVYEMLSGKLIGDSIPVRKRNAITRDHQLFACFKDDDYLAAFDEKSMERALELGWIDERDCARWKDLHEGQEATADAGNQIGKEAAWEMDEIDEMRAAGEQREIARIKHWAETFERKETWCKEYLAMRNAYFKMGGLEGKWGEIERHWLINAIWAVLDERRIALFNKETYDEVCGYLSRAIDAARNDVMGRGL